MDVKALFVSDNNDDNDDNNDNYYYYYYYDDDDDKDEDNDDGERCSVSSVTTVESLISHPPQRLYRTAGDKATVPDGRTTL